jgi:hypothetical protein
VPLLRRTLKIIRQIRTIIIANNSKTTPSTRKKILFGLIISAVRELLVFSIFLPWSWL